MLKAGEVRTTGSILWGAKPLDPENRWVHARFREIAQSNPDRPAIVTDETAWTYERLDKASNQVAALLRSLGVGHGDAVGIRIPRSPEMVAATLGVLKAGGCYLPMDPCTPPERTAFLLNDARAKLLLSSLEMPAMPVGAPVVNFEEAASHSPAPLPDDAGPGSLAYIMFTSGSTGQAKGTLIEHKSIIRLAIGADYCHLGPDSTILQLAPVSFDAATFEIWAALLNGGCLVIPPPRTLGLNEIGGAIRDHRVNTAFLTTALFHAFVDQAISELAGLRQLLVGGEVTSPAHVRRFCERHPSCQFIHVYGPTENTTFSTFHPVTAADFDGKPLAIGRPIAHTDVFLLNEDGQLAGVGEEGELCTGGMGLARGYLNRPDLNARQFVDHPLLPGERVYRSGDIARLRPDGNIDFIGRRDHQVKISGFRVELGEVECAILSCEGITQTCPIALRAPSGDKYLAAAVVASRLIDPAAVQREMAARFPEFLIPSSFKQVPSMPLNENGKIDRKAIEKLWERPLAFPAAPHASTEDKICAVWTEVLQLENPPRTINFFDLGGRSLHWIRVQSELRRRYGFAVEVTDLFRAPTIESLAALIGNAADAAPETAADANRAANSAQRAANQREALLRNKQRIVCGANPRINP